MGKRAEGYDHSLSILQRKYQRNMLPDTTLPRPSDSNTEYRRLMHPARYALPLFLIASAPLVLSEMDP
jgi:hypothetical protein